MIMNKMYENQKFCDNIPVIMAIIVVCINKINPIDKGCLAITKVIDNTIVDI